MKTDCEAHTKDAGSKARGRAWRLSASGAEVWKPKKLRVKEKDSEERADLLLHIPPLGGYVYWPRGGAWGGAGGEDRARHRLVAFAFDEKKRTWDSLRALEARSLRRVEAAPEQPGPAGGPQGVVVREAGRARVGHRQREQEAAGRGGACGRRWRAVAA